MYDNPNAPAPVPPGDAKPMDGALPSAAVQKFQSCRWRRPPENGSTLDYCTHRDVQPMAGTTGFDPEAWCPECGFYKIRRTLRKRPSDDYSY
jgi:hypothetical protein